MSLWESGFYKNNARDVGSLKKLFSKEALILRLLFAIFVVRAHSADIKF